MPETVFVTETVPETGASAVLTAVWTAAADAVSARLVVVYVRPLYGTAIWKVPVAVPTASVICWTSLMPGFEDRLSSKLMDPLMPLAFPEIVPGVVENLTLKVWDVIRELWSKRALAVVSPVSDRSALSRRLALTLTLLCAQRIVSVLPL